MFHQVTVIQQFIILKQLQIKKDKLIYETYMFLIYILV